jgi:allophanate hydrolase
MELRRECEATWESIDALCLPSTPTVYTLVEVSADPFGTNARLGAYTNFVNLLDLCALAVPGSPRADGRPAGVTFVAEAGRDSLLAAIGRRFLAEPIAAAPPSGEIVVAVVGAHMSGLPLNHELSALGAGFVGEAATAPDYRLFALPGTPPRRPGLLRVAQGEGDSIALELWSLSPATFGIFVAAIPAPLSMGTVRLSDGTEAKGFLVEAQGVQGAEDISGHGGWRAYLAAAPMRAADGS